MLKSIFSRRHRMTPSRSGATCYSIRAGEAADHVMVFAWETDYTEGRVVDGYELTRPAGAKRSAAYFRSSGGIDWNLYVITDAPYEGFLTEWSHSNWRGQRLR